MSLGAGHKAQQPSAVKRVPMVRERLKICKGEYSQISWKSLPRSSLGQMAEDHSTRQPHWEAKEVMVQQWYQHESITFSQKRGSCTIQWTG